MKFLALIAEHLKRHRMVARKHLYMAFNLNHYRGYPEINEASLELDWKNGDQDVRITLKEYLGHLKFALIETWSLFKKFCAGLVHSFFPSLYGFEMIHWQITSLKRMQAAIPRWSGWERVLIDDDVESAIRAAHQEGFKSGQVDGIARGRDSGYNQGFADGKERAANVIQEQLDREAALAKESEEELEPGRITGDKLTLEQLAKRGIE